MNSDGQSNLIELCGPKRRSNPALELLRQPLLHVLSQGLIECGTLECLLSGSGPGELLRYVCQMRDALIMVLRSASAP